MISKNIKAWLPAFSISLLIHAVLICLIPFDMREPEPELIITVRLASANKAANGAAPSPAQSVKIQPKAQAAPKERRTDKPTKPTKPAKPTAQTGAAKSAPVVSAVKEDAADRAADETSDRGVESSGTGEFTDPSCGNPGGEDGGGRASTLEQGGDIVDVSSLMVLKKTAPEYPPFSRKRGEEGRVTVIITIENGVVTGAEIEESSGYRRLDESAASALMKWRFSYSGRIKARVPVAFKLN